MQQRYTGIRLRADYYHLSIIQSKQSQAYCLQAAQELLLYHRRAKMVAFMQENNLYI